MSQYSKEMRTMYMSAPRNALLDCKTPTIIQVQCFEADCEKHWDVPQFGRVAFQNHEIFETYEAAVAYQNAVINNMVMCLRARQGRLNNEIVNVEFENA